MTPEKTKLSKLKVISLTYNIENKDLKLSIRKLFEKVFILEDKGCWIVDEDWSKYTYWCGEGAHRFVHRIINKEWIEGWMVCHHCDRPGCINPKHLFRGTAQDNARDMVRKGRGRKGSGKPKYITLKEAKRIHEDRQVMYHLPITRSR